MSKVNEEKKAICNCGKRWLWDWDNDVFCYEDGKEIKSEEIKIGNNEVTIFICDCGEINAIIIFSDDGSMTVFEGVAGECNFVGVNWEDNVNSYSPQDKNI